MALKLSTEIQNTGVAAEYWKIVGLNISKNVDVLDVKILLGTFVSKTISDEGADSLQTKKYLIKGITLEEMNASDNILALCYDKLKVFETTSMDEEFLPVTTIPFENAEDV